MNPKFNITLKTILFSDLLTDINRRTIKQKIDDILLKIFLVSIFLSTFQSCDLKLDEEFDHIPERPFDEAPGITDMYDFMSVDTLYFKTNQECSFRLETDTSKKNIKSIKMYLDGKPIEFDNSTRKFPKEPGTYKLRAEIYTNTETGSIAYHAGYERHLLEKEWTLIMFDIENYPNIQGNYSFEDGKLKLEWEEFPYPFIKYYKITYPWANDPSQPVGYTKNNYFFIDSGYYGHYKPMQITVITKGNSELQWCRINVGEIRTKLLSRSIDSCKSIEVSWNLYPIYSNIISTRLYVDDILHSSSNNVMDTVRIINDNVPFGLQRTVVLHYILKHMTDINDLTRRASLSIYSGFQYINPFNYDGAVYSAANNIFLNLRPDKYLISYTSDGSANGDTLSISNYREVSFTLSPDGTKFAILTNSGQIKYGEVNNLNQLITTPSLTYYNGLKISDNGVACIRTGYSIRFYNMNSMEFIDTLYGINSTDIGNLSSDARYFSVLNAKVNLVYKRENGIFTKLHELLSQSQSDNSYLKFNPLNPEQFFFWNSQDFSCMNFNNSEINFSYPLAVDKILHMDNPNNRMLVAVGSNLRIVRITDGTILNEIPFSKGDIIGSSIGDNSILVGNKIVSNSLIHCF